MIEPSLEQTIQTNITDLDLRKHLGESAYDDIIKYNELADVNSIYDLLPHDRSYKIILIEQKQNSGHWVAIYRYIDPKTKKDTLEAFDSYGNFIDGELKFIPKIIRRMLGQEKNLLTELFKKLPKDVPVVYNKKKFQKLKNGINTCGRWVILRTIMMKDFYYNLEDFIDFINKWKEQTGLTGDELVAHWVK
jgi:hypothetical protein